MAKKDKFSEINTQRKVNVADKLQTEISIQGQQVTATKEEADARAAAGNTQGRKGCKEPRINMAFWTENFEFIKNASKRNGLTMTRYCNYVIEIFRKEHPEEQAKADDAKKNAEELEATRLSANH